MPKYKESTVEFHVAECEECGWKSNPTESKEDLNSQKEYHEQTTHAPEPEE